MKKSRKRLTAAMAILCCLSLLVSSFAFFTDRLTANTGGTAGNLDLAFTDISSSKTGANGIESPNTYAIDEAWENEALISDGGVINPGDFFDLSYTLANKGNKSMDVRQQLILTSDVELTEGAEEYKLTIIGDHNDTVAVTGELQDDKKTIIYDLSDITLNGIGTGAETEAGVTISKETYIIRLDFDKNAGNAFMGSSVGVSMKAQAKQHRNTNDSHWVTWAEYEASYGEIALPEEDTFITIDADFSTMANNDVVMAGSQPFAYKISDLTPSADELKGSTVVFIDNATGEEVQTLTLAAGDITENAQPPISIIAEDLAYVVYEDNTEIMGMVIEKAGTYMTSELAGLDYSMKLICTPPAGVEGVKLSYENNTVLTGLTAEPNLVISPANSSAPQSIHYEVISGSEYVSVDPDTGIITGLEEGTATIKVTVVDALGETITSRCTVTSKLEAFAVYSSDDQSLTFYKRKSDLPAVVGETYNGKTVTEIYTGFESDKDDKFQVPLWNNLRSSIISVSFEDVVQPNNTVAWFYCFDNCTSMDLAKLDTSNVTSMGSMFYGCSSLNELDLSSFDTTKVTNMGSMFSGCSNLTALDLNSFDTTKVTSMASMFSGCSSLTNLDVTNFNTPNVTDMRYLFKNCKSLSELDLSSFDTTKVTIMTGMFEDCNNLKTISVSDSWSTESVTESKYMFAGCTSLVGGIAYDVSVSQVDQNVTYANTTDGYLTYKAAA